MNVTQTGIDSMGTAYLFLRLGIVGKATSLHVLIFLSAGVSQHAESIVWAGAGAARVRPGFCDTTRDAAGPRARGRHWASFCARPFSAGLVAAARCASGAAQEANNGAVPSNNAAEYSAAPIRAECAPFLSAPLRRCRMAIEAYAHIPGGNSRSEGTRGGCSGPHR